MLPQPSGCDVRISAPRSLGVAFKTGKKEVLLIFELRIQAGLVDAGRFFQVVNCRVREAVLPKDRDGPVQHTLTIELFRSSHTLPQYQMIQNYSCVDEPNGS